MKSLWSDAEARRFAERFAAVGEDVALRVYSSRLIGADPALVMHGGGNTSVKSVHRDLFGDEVEAIYVKGSGWNLDSIEPAGLPGLDLAYLRRLRAVASLSDEEMVNQLRTHLFDAASPNPSVETLLHAFLPAKFVDHSHANAILALTNRDDGEDLVREALGGEVEIVPYVMPGYDLAQAAADVAEANPDCRGLVLMRHGLFTWGETAQASYEVHIELVHRAEQAIESKCGGPLLTPAPLEHDAGREAAVAALAPRIRGLLGRRDGSQRWILDFRVTAAIEALLGDPEGLALLTAGPLTPDHVIRTKAAPLVLPRLSPGDEDGWTAEAESCLDSFVSAYEAYFRLHSKEKGLSDLTQLDPLPRQIAVAGLGIFGVGDSAVAAAVAADICQHTVEVKAATRALGPYRALDAADLFDVEYWSLEQAKLGRGAPKALRGRVALVTGAAGAIGAAVCESLARDGAAVVATDADVGGLERVRASVHTQGGTCVTVAGDVTAEKQIEEVFTRACVELGGVDIVVLNAGIARSAPLEDVSVEEWQRVLDVNLTGYFLTMREAARLFRRQASGGNVIVNASKNVFAPGAEFAAYSVSKSGGHQLGRLAAIELAPLGVRVNMVNPDAIFAHGEIRSGLWNEVGQDRARSRGLDLDGLEDYYRQRNLLQSRITAEDVARAILFFAREETPTTGATLPVDGGLPGAFPR
ncbi:MAG: bifunctional aldolase/short-chain dehydrogenase [Acidobacteriota bacterium]|nr:bifunctional aldolase/short-chain dehydrogenase [Acidobacteriota bacterium]